MKKYLLVSLTILFAATFVWAQETPTDPAPAEPAAAKPVTVAPAPAAPAVAEPAVTEPAIDIEAEATVSWGVDFGSKKESYKHGFNNEATWKVKFPIYKKADRTSTKSNVPVYGEVKLEEVKLDILSKNKDEGKFNIDGKVKGLEAKFVVYGAYLSVFDKPDFSANYAQIWEPREKDDKYEEDDFKFNAGFEGYGTKIGYANENLLGLDVGLKFGSDGNWKSEGKTEIDYEAPKNNHQIENEPAEIIIPKGEVWIDVVTNTAYFGDGKKKVDPGNYVKYAVKKTDAQYGNYGIGFDLSIAPLDKMLELALTVNSTLSADYHKLSPEQNKSNINFGVEAKSAPVEGLELKAGFDGMYVFAQNEFDWDAIFTAQYKWVGAGVYGGSGGTLIGGYDADKTPPRGKGDLAVFAKFETKADKKDATNLVEGLDAGVYVGMYQLIANAKTAFPFFTKVWGAYKININDSMWVKPFADLWLETKGSAVGLAYDVGVTYSPVEKVEVQAKWNQGTFKKNVYEGVIKESALEGGHYGTFVLSLTVKY